MSMFDKLARFFGLIPLHDFDVPDEPPTVSPLSVGTSTAGKAHLRGTGVDRSTAPGGEAGAVDHPNVDWDAIREGIAELRKVLTEALAWLDEIDPVGAGLAQAATVTVINNWAGTPICSIPTDINSRR